MNEHLTGRKCNVSILTERRLGEQQKHRSKSLGQTSIHLTCEDCGLHCEPLFFFRGRRQGRQPLNIHNYTYIDSFWIPQLITGHGMAGRPLDPNKSSSAKCEHNLHCLSSGPKASAPARHTALHAVCGNDPGILRPSNPLQFCNGDH